MLPVIYTYDYNLLVVYLKKIINSIKEGYKRLQKIIGFKKIIKWEFMDLYRRIFKRAYH